MFKRDIRTRDRRSLTVGLMMLGSIVISSLLSVGIGAIALAKTVKLETQFSEIETLQEELFVETKQLAANQKASKNLFFVIQSGFKNVSQQIVDIHRRIDKLETTLPQTMYLVTHLTSRFLQIKHVLQKAEQKLARNQMEKGLLEVLNITLPCDQNCPIELIEPNYCFHDKKNGEVHFNFYTKIISNHDHILIADPFKLLRLHHNQSKICRTNYKGPTEVLYNTELNCITQKDNLVRLSPNEILINSNAMSCIDRNTGLEKSELWTEEACSNKINITETSFFQIKFTSHQNYVYCPTKVIDILNQTHSCPDFPFSIPLNISFSVADFIYDSAALRTSNSLKLVEDWSFKINMHLESHSLQNNIVIDDRLINDIRTENFIPFSHQKNISNLTIILLVLLTLLVFTTLVLLRLLTQKTKTAISTNETNVELQNTAQTIERKQRNPLLKKQVVTQTT